jgi:hypothetical protein
MKFKLVKFRDGLANCVRQEFDSGVILIIPFDPANTDYQAYLKWLDEGNTPESAEEPA